MQVALPAATAADCATVFHHTLTQLGPFAPAPHLAVAVSGGSDSMACALLADQWARAHGGRITALTVDHGLRPESRAEAEQVARWMHARNITHHILTPSQHFTHGNLQETARNWRYHALANWCRAHDVLHCLLAHHAGDQRETVALHTQRGDTADGPSGMAATRNYLGVRFLRPLLSLEKSDLINWLGDTKWIIDPSNSNPRFARVRLRATLADQPAEQARLTCLTAEATAQRLTRDHALAHTAASFVRLHPAGYAEWLHAQWLALPEDIALQLLADILTTIGGTHHRPRRRDSERLAHALRQPSVTRRTLHGCEIAVRKGQLRIAREYARTAAPLTLEGTGECRWDGRFHVRYALPPGESLTLRALGPRHRLPASTPSLWHLDECRFIPHITPTAAGTGAAVSIGFAPAKPLAAAPFWWFNHSV